MCLTTDWRFGEAMEPFLRNSDRRYFLWSLAGFAKPGTWLRQPADPAKKAELVSGPWARPEPSFSRLADLDNTR